MCGWPLIKVIYRLENVEEDGSRLGRDDATSRLEYCGREDAPKIYDRH